MLVMAESDRLSHYLSEIGGSHPLLLHLQPWLPFPSLPGWCVKADGDGAEETSEITVLATDFKKAFIDDCPDVQQRFKDLNPNVQGGRTQIKKWLTDMLLGKMSSTSCTIVSSNSDSQCVTIRLEAAIEYLPIVWEFRGKHNDVLLYTHLMETFRLGLMQYSRREKELFCIIEEKDKRLRDSEQRFSAIDWTDADLNSETSVSLCRQFASGSSSAPFDNSAVRHVLEKSSQLLQYSLNFPAPPSADDAPMISSSPVVVPSEEALDGSSDTHADQSPVCTAAIKKPPKKKPRTLRNL